MQSRYLKDLISVSISVQIWISVFIFDLNIDVKWMYPYYGTRTRTRSVVLHIFRALEAREPPNLFFTYVRTRTHVCACVWCECGVCELCASKVVPNKKIDVSVFIFENYYLSDSTSIFNKNVKYPTLSVSTKYKLF
jgi:hypothetical protein